MQKKIFSTLSVMLLALLTAACPNSVSPDFQEPEVSNKAELSDLRVSVGMLRPAFAADISTYNVAVPNSEVAITLNGIKACSAATMQPADEKLELTNLEVAVPQTVTFTVTAQDGSTNKEYKITVSRFGEDYHSAKAGILKYVPAGTFQRDSGMDNISVVTSPFRMSRYPITRDQFQSVMGYDPSIATASTGIHDPVQQVNWYHAITFCNTLSIQEGLQPVYSISGSSNPTAWGAIPVGNYDPFMDSYTVFPDPAPWDSAIANLANNGYRLPSEMEWMWAAMGADQDSQPGAIQNGINRSGYSKPFAGFNGSNFIGDHVWYGTNTDPNLPFTNRTTRQVGTRLANELGLFDLSGNVKEWCWDLSSSNYPDGILENYHGPASASGRILRGGSWYQAASDCTLAAREGLVPESFVRIAGFRVVRP